MEYPGFPAWLADGGREDRLLRRGIEAKALSLWSIVAGYRNASCDEGAVRRALLGSPQGARERGVAWSLLPMP